VVIVPKLSMQSKRKCVLSSKSNDANTH